jgi:hypothetical protein
MKAYHDDVLFFGSKELEPCGAWLENCKLLRSLPEIDCQIITTPAIRDQLLSLEAAMAEAVEWKCCGDMSACTCLV